jgi:hypothetical protein
MATLKEVNDFLSTLDSLQARYHESVVIQQRGERMKKVEAEQTPEASAEINRYVDSQPGTF